jgi:hypothetical protein
MLKGRERRKRKYHRHHKDAREQRERLDDARVRECMKTFVVALEHAGKSPEEIERLSKLYALRLDRARRELCL